MTRNKIAYAIRSIGGIILSGQIAMSASAQSNEAKNLKETIQWGETKEGFSLSISLDKREISRGQPVLVTVRIKNVSDMELRLVETDSEKDYSFVLKDSEGKELPKLRYQKRLEETKEEFRRKATIISPGQVIEYKTNLGRRFDLSLEGEYSIQAQRQVLTNGGVGSVTLVSNIEIVIIR